MDYAVSRGTTGNVYIYIYRAGRADIYTGV